MRAKLIYSFCGYFCPMSEENQDRRKRRWILLWSFAGLLIITNIITLWLLWKEKNVVVKERIVKEQVIVERDNLSGELAALHLEYETLQTKDTALQREIEEKKVRIEELMKEAQKHK